jgi:rhamnosyltransferase
MSSVSIVIRALNESVHLPRLLEGLANQSLPPDQIVLVDSGSTDQTVALAAQAGADIVHITPEEFSFGRSLNRGCAVARGDVFVFVSAHVYPIGDGWLEAMVRPFDEHPDVALVYGRQTGDEYQSAFSELEIFRRWFPDQSDQNQDHPFCNNANCAVRATVWSEFPYDEELTGLEDLDWASRVQNAGYRIWYESTAGIVHLHREGFSRTRNRYRREAIAHKRIFGHQKMGLLEAFWLWLLNSGRDYLAAVPRRKLLRNLLSIPKFRAAQFIGTWQGFRINSNPTSALKRRFYYPKGFSSRADRVVHRAG